MNRTPRPRRRCAWCGTDPRMVDYHDREWGVPLHDDRELFELLILEGAQAGLTWRTILNKRDGSVQAEFGSFDAYIWRFVGGKPIDHRIARLKDIPVSTDESHAMSKGLAKRGFKFVGPTICYAFMQAAGLVNDHERACFRHPALRRQKAFSRKRTLP